MKTSVVVLSYNRPQLIHQVLMDLSINAKSAHEIVVVENGSDDPACKEVIDTWLHARNMSVPIIVKYLPENVGFSKAMNKGIFKATGDVVVALSNDVRINHPDFIEEIERNFDHNHNLLYGGTVYTQNTGWNTFGSLTVPYVEGYCVVASSQMWALLGGFDDAFYPYDFEDVDLSYRAVQLG